MGTAASVYPVDNRQSDRIVEQPLPQSPSRKNSVASESLERSTSVRSKEKSTSFRSKFPSESLERSTSVRSKEKSTSFRNKKSEQEKEKKESLITSLPQLYAGWHYLKYLNNKL